MKMITSIAAAIAAIVLACAPAAAQKDSALPVASTPASADALRAIQGSGCAAGQAPCANVKMSLAQIAAFVATSSPVTSAYQPLDVDLSAIAALGTTTTGRDLLTSADAAAIRSKAGVLSAGTYAIGTSGATVPLLNTANTWAAAQTFSGGINAAASTFTGGINGTTGTFSGTVAGSGVYVLNGGILGLRFTSAGASPRLQITDFANTVEYGAWTYSTAGLATWSGAIAAGAITTGAATFNDVLLLRRSPSAGYAADASATANTVTIANGSTSALPVGSGKVLITNFTNGDVCEYNVGGGGVSFIASTGGTCVAPTATPASGKSSLYWSGSAYIFANQTGASTAFSIVPLVRTRASN
jgi:hypothetical protein